MKRTLLIATAALLAFLSASAEDELVTKTFEVDDFKAIECSIPCEVKYSSSDKGLTVTANKKVLDNLSTLVDKDGKLTISLDKIKFYKLGGMKIYISSENLEKIELNGAVDFESEKGIDTESIDINLNGAAKMEINGLSAYGAAINANGSSSIKIKGIECEDIKVTVNGAGGCTLEGHAEKADLRINGVGGINIKEFTADKISEQVNGIGSISRK